MPKSRSKVFPTFSCPAIGCPFVTFCEITLDSHQRWGHCKRLGKERQRKSTLEKRRNKPRRMFPCPAKGCPYQGYSIGSLDAHRILKHPLKLPSWFQTCDKFIRGNLAEHMRRHAGIKPFPCVFDGCEKRFTAKQELTSNKKTHTIEGQIRQKKQENRLTKKLKEWGYIVDCETTIHAKMGACSTDTQRHFSRLDFRIVNCVSALWSAMRMHTFGTRFHARCRRWQT